MDLALQYCSYLLWFPLEMLAISAILRVGVRRYPLAFLYLVVTFLVAVAESPAAFSYYRSHRALNSALWYQSLQAYSTGLTYLLILAVVCGFLFQASAGLRSRRIVRVILIAGSVIFAAVTFVVHYNVKPPAGMAVMPVGMWMTPWTRDLNFVAAILDLALWLILLLARQKDQRLLILTGGMGIKFAGEAIGHAIRNLAIKPRSHTIAMTGNLVMLAADLVFLYVWWQAFRADSAAQRPRPAVAAAANSRP